MKRIYSLFLVPITIFSFSFLNVNSEEFEKREKIISLYKKDLKIVVDS